MVFSITSLNDIHLIMLSSAVKAILTPIMGVAYSPVVYSAELYARKAVVPIDIINLDFKASDENI